MKCADFEKTLDLFLDAELDDLQMQKIKQHLTECRTCQADFETRKLTREFLRVQPQILPETAFDNKMLKVFESHRKEKLLDNEKPSANLWQMISIWKYGSVAMLFFGGIALAFFLGRISASSSQILTTRELSEKAFSEKSESSSPSKTPFTEIVSGENQPKVITKYIKIPVVREKIVEKKVYINKISQLAGNETAEANFAENRAKESKIAEQFNLRDLQPISQISYKVIRKGENNDE